MDPLPLLATYFNGFDGISLAVKRFSPMTSLSCSSHSNYMLLEYELRTLDSSSLIPSGWHQGSAAPSTPRSMSKREHAYHVEQPELAISDTAYT